MRGLLVAVLLMTAAVSWAQPLQGPSVLFALPDTVTAENLFLTLREDGVADLFYQAGNQVFHAAAALENGTVTVEPHALPGPDAGWGRLLCGAVWGGSDLGWAVLVHDTTAQGNDTGVLCGRNGADSSVTIDSSQDWYSGDWYNTSRNSALTLAERFGGGFIAGWVDTWNSGDPWHQEGGISFASQICSPHAAEWLSPGFFSWSGETPLMQSVRDSVVLVLSSQWSGLVLDTLFADLEPDFPPASYAGAGSAVEFLALPGGSLFAISAANGTTLFELQDGQCHARITQPTPPVATASHRAWGLAWLSWGADGLYLTRADTSGALHQPAGEIDRLPAANAVLAASMAIHPDGRVVMLWLEYEDGESPVRLLKLASVGWDAPLRVSDPAASVPPTSFTLSASPNPFNNALRLRYELAATQRVTLSVYNLLGQEVTRLHDGLQTAGSHERLWQPTGSGGIYFVRLTSESDSRMQKVVYLK